MHHLYVSYDVGERDDGELRQAIAALGKCHQFHRSLCYLHTEMGGTQAFYAISRAMRPSDCLAVIDVDAQTAQIGPPIKMDQGPHG